MFIPIIIDPSSFYDFRYLWVYLKFLMHCYDNNWPIITTEEFENYRVKIPNSNVYEDCFCNKHQYRLLSEEEESKVKKYFIPDSIFQELRKKTKSKFEMKVFLLQNRYRPLEKEMKKIIKEIKRNSAEDIEGIINWNEHFASIRYIGEKEKIPVLINEFSVRFPEFYTLSYICKKELYCENEIAKLYQLFIKAENEIQFNLYTKKELRYLLLEKNYLIQYISKENKKPKYEIGIAGSHPIISTYYAKSSYMDLELIEDIKKLYSEKDILLRTHPGDEPYCAKYRMKNSDTSLSSIEFILECKRVVAIASNLLLEAMLLEKQVYAVGGISQFSTFLEGDLSEKKCGVVDDKILNFIFFGYLVAYDRLYDKDYLKWRIKEKKISRIFIDNVNYIFKARGIPKNIIYVKKNRNIEILKYRNVEN